MSYIPPIILDGKPVEKITAFLFDQGGNDDPAVLLANANKSFNGTKIYGQGFIFDDTDDEATHIAEMHRLIEKDPRNAERIFPYIGGEEVNSSPTHSHHRYVINFFDMSEEEAWKYPDLMQIVKDKVKPERDVQKRDALRIRWWQYAEKRPGLVRAIAQCDRVLVIPEVTARFAFAFLPANCVFAHTLKIVVAEDYATFSIVQSSIHEIWARFFGSSLEDRLRYTSSDCFETFPFPLIPNPSPTVGEGSQTAPVPLSHLGRGARGEGLLEATGKTYYEFRADLMVRHNEGLTATYNRFHDPDETNPDILHLRDLHAQMDRAVLDAYGWTDIPTTCEFRLDYEDEDTDSPLAPSGRGVGGEGRKRKKPWHYRWPEAVHDEVLARLLKLNQERAEAEKLGGKTKRRKEPAKPVTADSKLPPDKEQLDLF